MDKQPDTQLKEYCFSWRVHPERYQWTIEPVADVIVLHHDGAKSRMQTRILVSQLIVTVQTNSSESVLDMKNRVNRQARNLTDALGHVTGAALDVEILTCVSSEREHYVFNTAFDGLLGDDIGSTESVRLFNALIAQANQSQFVRMALSDLRNAIREPLDTCVNCYRAVESIRHAYLGDDPDSGQGRKKSWVRLRTATGMEEADLRWLEERATPRRHGRPVDVSHADRKRALLIARQVVEKHCLGAKENAEHGEGVISEMPETSAP